METFPLLTSEDDAIGAKKVIVDAEDVVTVLKVDRTGTVDGLEITKDGVIDVKNELADGNTGFAEARAGFFDADSGFAAIKGDLTGLREVEEIQSPNLDWQPVSQYSLVEPQYPFCEQQSPKAEFLQVRVSLDCFPQRAEALTRRALTLRNGIANKAKNRANCIVRNSIE